jgi:hypothetical protein
MAFEGGETQKAAGILKKTIQMKYKKDPKGKRKSRSFHSEIKPKKSSIFHEPDISVATEYRTNSRGNKIERYVPIQILRHLGIYIKPTTKVP